MTKAAKWYRIAAERGLAEAQFRLAGLCKSPQEQEEALKWYRMAAEQGHSEAQVKPGYMYGDGQGVRQDYSEAAKRFLLAAEGGLKEAQDMLRHMYVRGQALPHSEGWFRLVAIGQKLTDLLAEIEARNSNVVRTFSVVSTDGNLWSKVLVLRPI